ncbi:MAG TPA: uroporphyrinogen decarboxylase family protein [Syntrophomonas sp.]|nr:uroporphyrinogen decarboxylase family protein [Syntrophomonas sp.]
MNIPFSEKEIANIRRLPGMYGLDYPAFDHPATHKENYLANLEGHGYWVPTSNDVFWFCPTVFPDNQAKGNVHEVLKVPKDQMGGKDMFGIEWEYGADIGGSTVRPGNPALEDANEWHEKIVWPDLDSWDWQNCADRNRETLASSGLAVELVICTGWFERLVSFMDFAQAAVAMVDKNQKNAVKELFEKLTDLYIRILDKFLEYFPGLIHAVTMHDDWGGQASTFFGDKTVEEMLVAPQKRMAGYIKSKGLYAGFHCCGKIDRLLPYVEKIGYQKLEAQPLVDKDAFYQDYGKRIMLTVTADPLPENATDDDCRKAAREFVDKYFGDGKRCLFETYYSPVPYEFLKELYIYSRKKSNTF